ncbi:hypothetical protein [uncultured Bacteroides sp.]|uniref:hypothetical protein n=1 Tax=uncultured Bacteroides sp. TaxID=162156 RepID=UPI00259526C3|nr:hypothetical protein [uncultured Bacteroides sp.]
MKKIIFMALAFSLFACSSPENKPFVVDYTDRIIGEYPNFGSNEIAKKTVQDSIQVLGKSYIGKSPKTLNGVDFKFEELFENGDSVFALFSAVDCVSDIEDKSGSHKYIITPIEIRVLGRIDSQTAAKLDGNCKYHIDGVLHEWDEKDRFLAHRNTGGKLFFGTYILDNMNVKLVSNE